MKFPPNNTRSIGCLAASIISYGIINVLLVIADLSDVKDQPIYQTIFLIAYSLWQVVNIVVCIHCAFEPEATHTYKVYLTINEILLMVLSGTAIVIVIGVWLLLHCNEPACKIIDHFCGCAILLAIAIGTSGCTMMYETLRLCKNEVGFTFMQSAEAKK